MSELATLARPYAVAVFKRAKETSSATRWSDTLSFLSAVINNAEIKALVGNPRFSKDKLSQLILDIGKDKADADAVNFIKLLTANNRMGLLPKIAQIFEELKAESEGYIDVSVQTAFPFSKEGEQKFAAALEKTLNKKVHMNVAVDQSLIGGVLVRAGDRVIDGSIRGQLQNLRKALQ
ncbi:MAG: F0F1 ATP synthase subunit delta [Gammaproteobacteria bacterium]|nr:F0F1 ATP synthase subunit delta [Gammaproteobacteria bacterium]